MREPRRRPGLALETAADDPLPGQDLDRHIALEALVTSHPDGAESAGAEPALQPIAVEHQRHRRRVAWRDGGWPACGYGPWMARRSAWSAFPRLRGGPCAPGFRARRAQFSRARGWELVNPAARGGHTARLSPAQQGAVPLVVLRRGRRTTSDRASYDPPHDVPRRITRPSPIRPRRSAPRRRPSGDQQSIQARRGVAIIVVIIVIVLVALLVHSCQVSATNSALQDYTNSVSSLNQQSVANGQQLFTQLSQAAGSSEPAPGPARDQPGPEQRAERLQEGHGGERPGSGQDRQQLFLEGAEDARRRDQRHRQ